MSLTTQPTTTSTATVAPRTSAQVRYAVDPSHAAAHFKVRHLMVASVRGELGPISGEASIDPNDLTRSSVAVTIDATKIDTRNADRDAHLRSADFLDVANHPTIGFRSTAVRAKGAGELEVDGDLTIRGVTRPVTLEVELSDEIKDPWGNLKRGASATARIDRKDFGLTWNAALETGGVVVADRVDISIELELSRVATAA
jgi:polyisoprenoid-binding protein YceI